MILMIIMTMNLIMSDFVSVRTAYYKDQQCELTKKRKVWAKDEKGLLLKNKAGKSYKVFETTTEKHKGTIELLDHILRLKNTNSLNPNEDLSHFNTNFVGSDFENLDLIDAYNTVKVDFEAETGKKSRKDMNTTLEVIVIFSEGQIEILEKKLKLKYPDLNESDIQIKLVKGLEKKLKIHCEGEENAHGMKFVGGALHMDEGHVDQATGKWKRNIHAHCLFFNYDFKFNRQPLKQLSSHQVYVRQSLEDSKRDDDLRASNHEELTKYKLNQNFVAMQDRIAESFKNLGFNRGISKQITNAEHKDKSVYVREEKIRKEIEQNKLGDEITKNLERQKIEIECNRNEIISQKKEITNLEKSLKPIRNVYNKFQKWFKEISLGGLSDVIERAADEVVTASIHANIVYNEEQINAINNTEISAEIDKKQRLSTKLKKLNQIFKN